ncbi:serine hydrolase domain-containing protein [Streptomyces sp. NPDC000410]|uniref:serine hydrolase domain-containing protein n=1 Tax=Streptomyces sp. NPDC000410 TaxID=3154254 RepID=UPI00332C0F63
MRGFARVAPAVLALLFTMVATATASAATSSPPPRPAEVRAFLDKEIPARLAACDIPGASVSVVLGGRQLAAQGYGIADTGRRTPVSADRTRFLTGSVAKVLTAVAVMQLVEEGKLDPRADVNRYLTRFKIADTYPGRPVTVEHLLTHTSGFDTVALGAGRIHPRDAGDLEEFLRTEQPARVRPPGQVPAYDNYGVALAGYLVQAVSGRPFAAYMDERVLSPLGMTRTTFDQSDPRMTGPDTAHGYRPSDGGPIRARGQFGAMSPTGAGTVTTAADMGRLMRALLDGGRLGGSRILRPESVTALESRHFGPDPRLPGMAYLLTQDRRDGQNLLLKDGDVPGFHSLLALLPERDTGIYVTFNGDGANGAASFAARDLVNAFVAHFFPGGTTPTTPPTAAPLTDAARYEGTYRSSRTSTADLTKAAALMGDVTVTADGADGGLTTDGPLSYDPDKATQHWIPVGDGLFRERGGQDTIAFADGRLLTGQDPTVAYERSSWYASSRTHQLAAGAALLVLLTGLFGWPLTALIRRARGRTHRPSSGWGARFARVVAWTLCVLPVVFLGLFLTLVLDANALNETVFLGSSPLLAAALQSLTATAVAAVATLGCAAVAWRRGWWGRAGRIHYTLIALAAPLFLAVMADYHLIG